MTFGLDQADAYVAGLYDCLASLAANPNQWPAVELIRPGLRVDVFLEVTPYIIG